MVDSISTTPVSFDVASSIVAEAFGRDAALTEADRADRGGQLLKGLRPSFVAELQQVVDAQIAGFLRQMHDIYLFVIMVVEVAFRHEPTDDIERFARSRLATTLDRFAAPG